MTPSSFSTSLYGRLRSKEIPSLNGLRAIAVFAVILGHNGFDKYFRAGEGVILFFVLSGFLITWLLLEEREKFGDVSLKNFYVRRTLRIFPAFYAFFCVAILLTVVAHQHVYWGHALSAIGYYSNYYYAHSPFTIDALDHTWSLSVEEQFYLLWPATFLLLSRSKVKLTTPLVTAILGVWFYRAYMLERGASERYIYHVFHARVDQLLIGCLLAVMLHERKWLRFWEFVSRGRYILVSVLIFAFAMQLPIGKERLLYGYMIYPVVFAVLIVQCIMAGDWLNLRPIRFLGIISYPLYLYHLPVSMVVSHFMKSSPQWLVVLVICAVTIATSTVSYYVIEKPALTLKSKLQTRRVPVAEGNSAIAVIS